MLCQDHPHRFATDFVDHAAFDGVLGEQPNCPPRATVRRRPAHQRDQRCFLSAVQLQLASRPRLLAERVVQATSQITLGYSRNLTRVAA